MVERIGIPSATRAEGNATPVPLPTAPGAARTDRSSTSGRHTARPDYCLPAVGAFLRTPLRMVRSRRTNAITGTYVADRGDCSGDRCAAWAGGGRIRAAAAGG